MAKPVRMALGSLIIQSRCGYTDRETVQQITENPYLQYFIGLKEYQLTKPFTPVALVKFRKRFNAKRLAEINELIVAKFGEGKRKYGLNRIADKLKETSESVIMLQFLVMNLEHKLRVLFAQILFWIFGRSNRAILVG